MYISTCKHNTCTCVPISTGVSTTCVPTRKDRGPMQCRLISEGCFTSSNNFLYKVSDLSNAFARSL